MTVARSEIRSGDAEKNACAAAKRSRWPTAAWIWWLPLSGGNRTQDTTIARILIEAGAKGELRWSRGSPLTLAVVGITGKWFGCSFSLGANVNGAGRGKVRCGRLL